MCVSIAKQIIDLRQKAEQQNRRAPSTSEFLDAVKAADYLQKGIANPVWDCIQDALLEKNLDA